MQGKENQAADALLIDVYDPVDEFHSMLEECFDTHWRDLQQPVMFRPIPKEQKKDKYFSKMTVETFLQHGMKFFNRNVFVGQTTRSTNTILLKYFIPCWRNVDDNENLRDLFNLGCISNERSSRYQWTRLAHK
jgi:hypothetical protein